MTIQKAKQVCRACLTPMKTTMLRKDGRARKHGACPSGTQVVTVPGASVIIDANAETSRAFLGRATGEVRIIARLGQVAIDAHGTRYSLSTGAMLGSRLVHACEPGGTAPPSWLTADGIDAVLQAEPMEHHDAIAG